MLLNFRHGPRGILHQHKAPITSVLQKGPHDLHGSRLVVHHHDGRPGQRSGIGTQLIRHLFCKTLPIVTR